LQNFGGKKKQANGSGHDGGRQMWVPGKLLKRCRLGGKGQAGGFGDQFGAFILKGH